MPQIIGAVFAYNAPCCFHEMAFFTGVGVKMVACEEGDWVVKLYGEWQVSLLWVKSKIFVWMVRKVA